MKPSIHTVIASSAPIINSGLAVTLQRISEVRITSAEAISYQDLVEKCRRPEVRMVFVTPSFGGIFNPTFFRKEVGEEIIIVGIEVGPIPPDTRNLFDATVSVIDDSGTLSSKIINLISNPEESQKPKDQLSQREKEIVTLVVKGLTNKEIAERLFLSVHTVITHRRNIARKLEIHSATGLTIYAIVNHLVDITEIKM